MERPETTETEQQLMRAPFVESDADKGTKVAAVILLVCGVIVVVLAIIH